MWSVQMDLFLCLDKSSLTVRCHSNSHLDGSVTCLDGISTGLRLASLLLPYTHFCMFIDLSCHVVCSSCGFLLRFWHSLYFSSHSMICIVFPCILLSFCDFRILEYLLIETFFFEILCMKILLCLCVGLILIYLGHLDCDLCFCNTWASDWQLS
jgi:hypothetical protein